MPRRLDVQGAVLIGCAVAVLSFTVDRAERMGLGFRANDRRIHRRGGSLATFLVARSAGFVSPL